MSLSTSCGIFGQNANAQLQVTFSDYGWLLYLAAVASLLDPGYIMVLYRGYLGIMEKKMETTIMVLYRGYIGIMEKKMETTI